MSGKLTDLAFPDCWLCRSLRISMSIGIVIVLLTYAGLLLKINVEMHYKEQ